MSFSNILFCLFFQVLSKFNPDFDPSVVLDFLVTCVHLQKQWQCRDRHVPKHDSGYQDVLTLTDEQVSQVDKKICGHLNALVHQQLPVG